MRDTLNNSIVYKTLVRERERERERKRERERDSEGDELRGVTLCLNINI